MSLKRQWRFKLAKKKINIVREPIKQIAQRIADKLRAFGDEYEKLGLRQQIQYLARIKEDLVNFRMVLREPISTEETADRQGHGEAVDRGRAF